MKLSKFGLGLWNLGSSVKLEVSQENKNQAEWPENTKKKLMSSPGG